VLQIQLSTNEHCYEVGINSTNIQAVPNLKLLSTSMQILVTNSTLIWMYMLPLMSYSSHHSCSCISNWGYITKAVKKATAAKLIYKLISQNSHKKKWYRNHEAVDLFGYDEA